MNRNCRYIDFEGVCIVENRLCDDCKTTYKRPQSNAAHKDVPQRYVEPAANLIYAILLQAARDNDIDFLRHGDGRTMYEWLKKQRQYAEPVSAFGNYECYQSMNVLR